MIQKIKSMLYPHFLNGKKNMETVSLTCPKNIQEATNYREEKRRVFWVLTHCRFTG